MKTSDNPLDRTNARFSNGFGSLEPRMLLAADLYVVGLLNNNNPQPMDFGFENAATTTNGNPYGFYGPGHLVDLDFRLANSGDVAVNRPQIAILWDDDNDITNGYLRVLDSWTVENTINSTDDSTNPQFLDISRQFALPADANVFDFYDSTQIADDYTYYIHVVPDPFDAVGEDDETNNSTVANDTTLGSGPSGAIEVVLNDNSIDLIGTYIEMTTDFESAYAGGEIDVTYTIRNTGDLNSNPFSVRFYLSKDVASGEDSLDTTTDLFLGTDDWIGGLSGENGDLGTVASDSATRTIQFTLPEEGDPWYPDGNPGGINEEYRIAMQIVMDGIFPDETLGFQGNGLQNNNDNLWYDTYTFNDIDTATGFSLTTTGAEEGLVTFDAAPFFIWAQPELTMNPLGSEVILDPTPGTADNLVLTDDGSGTPLAPTSAGIATVTIYNASKIAAGAFNVSLYLSKDIGIAINDDLLLGTVRVNGIAGADIATDVAGTAVVQIPYTLPTVDQANFLDSTQTLYYIGAIVNPPTQLDPPTGFEVSEDLYADNANEGIDTDIVAVTIDTSAVPAPGGPGGGSTTPVSGVDLVPVQLKLNKSNLKAFQKMKLSFRVRNDGTVDAPATRAAIFASSNKVYNKRDEILGYIDIPALTAGETSSVFTINDPNIRTPHDTSSVFGSGSTQNIFIGIRADADNLFTELDEENNTQAIKKLRVRGIQSNFQDIGGNNADTATRFNPVLNKTQQFQEYVGGTDRSDWWIVTLNQQVRLNLRADKNQSDIRLTLFERDKANLEIVADSNKAGSGIERIRENIGPGTYYIRVKPTSDNIRSEYRLRVTPQKLGGGSSTSASLVSASASLPVTTVAARSNTILQLLDDQEDSFGLTV